MFKDFCGESVGMLKLSGDSAQQVTVRTELYLGQGRRHEPYEEAIRDVLLTSPRRTFAFEDITGLPWIEIDFAADVDRAEAEILPRKNAAAAKRRAIKTIKGDMDKGAALNL